MSQPNPQEPPADADVGALVKRMRKRLPMLPRYSRDAELLAEAAGELVRLAAHVEALQARVTQYEKIALLARYVNSGTHGHRTTMGECLGVVEALAELYAAPLFPSTSEGIADGK